MSSFPIFKSQVEAAILACCIPGITAVALNASGSFRSSIQLGNTLLGRPVTPSSPMYIASMTKLVTTICALQLVDRGALSLDTPIWNVLPELRDLKVLAGFDQLGSPILVDPNPVPTLRHLLTHTSGFTYLRWGLQPGIDRWIEQQKHRSVDDLSVQGFYFAPLAFHPGTSWGYGGGIDIAGLMVARASKMSLQAYLERYMIDPLGLTSTTFANHLDEHPDISARILDAAERVGMDGIKESALPAFLTGAPDEHGGAGLVSSMEDYVKILQALLVPGRLLGKEMLDEMFRPQLEGNARAVYMAAAGNSNVRYTLGIAAGELTQRSWGLGGGVLLEDDEESGMRKDTLVWSGMPNMQWWISRQDGLVGVFGLQLMATDDKVAGKVGGQWGKEVRTEFRRQQAGPMLSNNS